MGCAWAHLHFFLSKDAKSEDKPEEENCCQRAENRECRSQSGNLEGVAGKIRVPPLTASGQLTSPAMAIALTYLAARSTLVDRRATR
jgi:hypothetical protein